jgi:hypothetical protein
MRGYEEDDDPSGDSLIKKKIRFGPVFLSVRCRLGIPALAFPSRLAAVLSVVD